MNPSILNRICGMTVTLMLSSQVLAGSEGRGGRPTPPPPMPSTHQICQNETAIIVDAVAECPQQLAELSQLGQARASSHEWIVDHEVYTISFVSRPLPPRFIVWPVGKLIITRTFVPSPGPTPADGPGGKNVYECTVSKEAL